MEPLLEIVQLSATAEAPGLSRVMWRIGNRGSEPVELASIWLPHGQFRSEERGLSVALAAGESCELATSVRFVAEPGEVVENGFVILTVRSADETWQVFARLRITAEPDRQPQAEVERITVQREGSSTA
ncbi:MAG TPA: hypothetical protein VK009_03755 [Chloroflexota bacterium]|nr:hypothetical protein [Chloroflexota bacterium]